MGVITNGSGGGAGGGIRYNAQTDMIQVKVNGQWVDTPYKAYGTFDGTIYDAGVQAVPLDNTGYAMNGTTTPVGGATLGASSFAFTTSGTSASTNKSICNDDAIDLSNWNTLHYIYRNTHKTLDISSVSVPAYITFYLMCNGAGSYYLNVNVSSAKNWFTESGIVFTSDNIASSAANVTGNFTKVWLE